MGWSEFLDGHVQQGLILNGLFFTDPCAPLVELLVSFKEQNDLSIVRDLVGKFGMFLEVPIELHA